MAIQKPYNLNIRGTTIDGQESNLLTWQVSGDTSLAYSISILKNSDNSVAYSYPKTTTYATSHTLPAGSLINGNDYKISITVWDAANNSASSDYDIFSTSSRPVVSVSTIGTIANSSYNFSASYTQAESVAIKSWMAFLYDNSQNLLAQSTLQTSTSLQYLFSNLYSGNNYYVEFQATSSKGLTGTSGKMSFSVLYSAPNVKVDVAAENTDDAGIKLTWNVSQIIGHSDSSTYIGGEKLDVTSGKSVTFDSGILVQDDFTLKTWIEGLTNYTINTEQIALSSTPPTNINTLWMKEDSGYGNGGYGSTPYGGLITSTRYVDISVSNIAPTDVNNLWIKDSNQVFERSLGLKIDLNQPSSSNYIWLNTENQKTSSEVITLNGDNNQHLSLEYYNSTFYLVKYDSSGLRTELVSRTVTGSQFYIYIQQIGDSYNLGVNVIV